MTRARVLAVAMAVVASAAFAEEVGVLPRKLVVLDKLAAAGKAKVVFVAVDDTLGPSSIVDVTSLTARVEIRYGDGAAVGIFEIPTGSATGWVEHSGGLLKYENKAAPSGLTQAKLLAYRPGVVKFVGKGLGETPFAILAAGAPNDSVFLMVELTPLLTAFRLCSEFPSCVYQPIANGTGAKLVCKGGNADPDCSVFGDVCCAGIAWCGWADSVTACANLLGTPGAPGSVCDAVTGACVVAPATPGFCCDDANFDGSCFAGPAADQTTCESNGGTFVPDAICTPSGSCVP